MGGLWGREGLVMKKKKMQGRVVFVSSSSKVVMAKANPWKVPNVEKGTCGRILYHCNDKKVVIWQR